MSFKVMSFNVRGSFHDEDGINAWENRCSLNIKTIKHYDPDIIGFQETQTGNLADYEKYLPDYTHELGLISIRQTERRHYVPIYYRSDRFEKVQSGGFYLSETPLEWSIGWDAIYPRAVTWIILRDKMAHKDLLVLNTHYNHERDNQLSRNNSSALIINQIAQLADDLPQLVMADFNANPDSDAYRIFIDEGFQDTFTLAGCEGNPNTVHAFQGDAFPHQSARIDWILLNNTDHQLIIQGFDIIKDHQHPVYPSDHYPIMTQFDWTHDHA